jgi:serine protease
MTRRIKISSLHALTWRVIVLLGIGLAGIMPANAASHGPHKLLGWTQTTSRIIVHYRTASAATLKTNTALHTLSTVALVPLKYRRTTASGAHVLLLPHPMTVNEAQQVAQRLAHDPNVLYAQPSHILRVDAVPNDPLFHLQWALGSKGGGINMEAAWNLAQGSPSIVMAVLDTGILKSHPEFQGRLLPGYNFISDPVMAGNKIGRTNDPEDLGDFCNDGQSLETSDWHGSHVAGIMGARAGNGIGIAGIDPRSMILPVRIIGRCGGSEADAEDAMRWAAGLPVPGVPLNAHPARVINMSLGAPGACTQEMQLAVNEVRARGAVVVAAAGNDGVNAVNQFPANCKGVVTVAAVDQNGNKVSNSLWSTNYGQIVTISAPGEHILSSVNAGLTLPTQNNYGYLDGTSQAAPQVAGVLALMLSVNPHLTPAGVTTLLLRSRRPFATGANCAGNCQAGMLDAYRAVLLARDSLGAPATPNDSGSATMAVFAGPAQTVRPGQTVYLHGSARVQAPVTIRALHWMQLSGPRVALSNSYAAVPRFVAPATTATLVFQLTAKDSQGRMAGSKTVVRVVATATRSVANPLASGNAGAAGGTVTTPAASLPSTTIPSASAAPAGSSGLLGSLLTWLASLFT